MKKLLLACRIVVSAFAVVLTAAACGPFPIQNPRLPPFEVHYVHVESVEMPAQFRAGQPADIRLTVSANANPQVLTDPEREWGVSADDAKFRQAVAEGRYPSGEFVGPFIGFLGSVSRPGGRMTSPPGQSVVVPVTFSEPGTQYLYIGHIADPARGGHHSEVVGFPDTPPFEYIQIEVEVLP